MHAEVEVCYLGSADEAKCKTALEDAYGTGPGWKCVKGSSSDDCLQKVREGDAHVTVVGGEREGRVKACLHLWCSAAQ